MGTLVAIQATGSSTAVAETAIQTAFAVLNEIEDRLHPQSPGSDLARINSSPLRSPIPVHASTCTLLGFARHLNTLTAGVFDPCLPSCPGRLQDVEIWQGQVLCHEPVALDFGGFAKGYAVDCAIETLMKQGCSAGLVNAGGDLRVFGPHIEPVFVRAREDDLACEVALSNAAIAVSEANSQRRPPEHQGYYTRVHTLPQHTASTNLPNAFAHQPLVSDYAAVIAEEAMVADALTKCVLLCSEDVVEQLLHTFEATRVLTGKTNGQSLGAKERRC
jgi:thiamine biosynthesis lipoprotein